MSYAVPPDTARDTFLDWLDGWYDSLPRVSFAEALPDPARATILVTDLIVGFCTEGALASERIQDVVPATVRLLEEGHARGMRRFLFAQDTHDPETPEFGAWPVHCVRGTRESEMVPELAPLPFASEFTVIEKNALSAAVSPELQQWLESNDDVTHYLVTGDCTDLCVYQMAMYVRMWANATNRVGKTVIVDASAVQTYELSVEATAASGGMPHPGDLMHRLFLYHLALNGVKVVGRILI
jgi:nicotinamidase-related amidase